MHPDWMRDRAELRGSALVEVDIGGEAFGGAADDSEHERKPIARGADDRLGCTTNPYPSGQVSRLGLGEDIGVLEWCTHGAAPGDGLLLKQLGEELDLFLEQHVVVTQVVSEERE